MERDRNPAAVERVAYIRRPVREAEAAHAKTTEAGKCRQAEVEKAAADLREAREKARDTLGEGWPKAANALSGKLTRVAGPAQSRNRDRVANTARRPKTIKITTADHRGRAAPMVRNRQSVR